MFGSGFKADHLHNNLKLAVTRLKILEKNKTELVQRKRKEIADYLAAGKHENARIQVEHIIREDYIVEVLEILNLYCQLLLERLGLIKTMKQLSPDLEEAVSSVIWCTSRVEIDVPELKPISVQLRNKYGKKYGKLCQEGKAESINPKLMQRLSTTAPSKCLVQKYLIEISNHYNIPYQADFAVSSEVQLPDLSHLAITGEKNWETGLYGGDKGDYPDARYVSPPQHHLGFYEPKKSNTILPPFKPGVEPTCLSVAQNNPVQYYTGPTGCFQAKFSENTVPPALPACPPLCDLPPGYAYASLKRNSNSGRWYQKFTK